MTILKKWVCGSCFGAETQRETDPKEECMCCHEMAWIEGRAEDMEWHLDEIKDRILQAAYRSESVDECVSMLNGALDLKEVGRVFECLARLDDARRECR